MGRPSRFSPEVRDRAVRMVLEHQHEHDSPWAAIGSIASKIGCMRETLRRWVRQAETETGKRAGLTTEERARLEQLEREVFELRRANEILRKASVRSTGRCNILQRINPVRHCDTDKTKLFDRRKAGAMGPLAAR